MGLSSSDLLGFTHTHAYKYKLHVHGHNECRDFDSITYINPRDRIYSEVKPENGILKLSGDNIFLHDVILCVRFLRNVIVMSSTYMSRFLRH